jgi:sodium-dependent phosphate cotransporter
MSTSPSPQAAAELPGLSGPRAILPRLLALLVLLYVFLVSIKLLSGSIKMMGAGVASGLFEGVQNPLASLAVGILATVLVQSSSVTTSTIVGLVGTGTIPVEYAVPMIMGANIGTTVTNTLVSLGSVGRKSEFRRAFAAATVHDFFNLLAVAVFLPIQIWTGFLHKSAHAITGWLGSHGIVGEAGGSYSSPIKAAVGWASGGIKHFVTDTIGLEGTPAGLLVLSIGLLAIFFSLTAITKTMRAVIADKAEKSLNAALKKSGLIAIAIGAMVTMAVQSSSITTSLLVPLCAGGILTLENAFPVMLGANIGTTITAFIASLATDVAGLEIALVHVQFNLLATALFYPFATIRAIPIRLARMLALQAVRNKIWVIIYVVSMFVCLPLFLMFIFN